MSDGMIEVFTGADGKFYWHLISLNTRNISATGGQGFKTKEEIRDELNRLRDQFSGVPVHDKTGVMPPIEANFLRKA